MQSEPVLWGRASSVNVQKVMWALAELDVAHTRKDAGGRYGQTDTDAFARMNPLRRVPVWQENGLTLWESHAIIRHLARHHAGLECGPVADQWMEYTSTTLQPPFIGLFWQKVRFAAKDRSEALIQQHLTRLEEALLPLAAHLDENKWIGGQKLSIADIAAGALMFRYFDLDVPRADLPAISRWYRDLAARPCYRETVMTSYDELRA